MSPFVVEGSGQKIVSVPSVSGSQCLCMDASFILFSMCAVLRHYPEAAPLRICGPQVAFKYYYCRAGCFLLPDSKIFF